MDYDRAAGFINAKWASDVMPALTDYITLPCQSPAFDPSWAENGQLEAGVELLADWARTQLAALPGSTVEIVRLAGRTPTLLIETPGVGEPALIYGHFDKQPPMEGWTAGRSAFEPRLEGERLYGRGGADDGYAMFSAILALLALADQGLPAPRCIILIEGSEESGSPDLPAVVAHLSDRLGSPRLLIALDAGCGDYERLWTTTSLRGQVAGRLQVSVLEAGVHSGDGSGVAPSSFRIATALVARIEDPATGKVIDAFTSEIPDSRRKEAGAAAAILGDGLRDALPFLPGVAPVSHDPAELLLNRSWRPQLATTGIDGLPPLDQAASVMRPSTTIKLSLRLPPTVDAEATASQLTTILENDPPYAAHVSFTPDMASPGWHAPETPAWLAQSLQTASMKTFGQPPAAFGGGGGIPFLNMLGELFPETAFVVTGVLGPESNAHGPNEFLHLPTARKITVAIAGVLGDLSSLQRASVSSNAGAVE